MASGYAHRIAKSQLQQKLFAPSRVSSGLKVLLVWPKLPAVLLGLRRRAPNALPEAADDAAAGSDHRSRPLPARRWTLRLLDHAFDEVRDEDLRWADLVMVSAMRAQRADAVDICRRAKAVGTRTFVGGPWAGSDRSRSDRSRSRDGWGGRGFARSRELELGTARARSIASTASPTCRTPPYPASIFCAETCTHPCRCSSRVAARSRWRSTTSSPSTGASPTKSPARLIEELVAPLAGLA